MNPSASVSPADTAALYDAYVMKNYGRPSVNLVRGEGTNVWDDAGRRYLYFTTGIAVNALGHCHPRWVAAVQAQFGRDKAGEMIEHALAKLASGLAAQGVRRFVIAGGETSGAVVSALKVEALELGPQIALGVPACLSYGNPRYALALKSGNFGGPDFFAQALEALA